LRASTDENFEKHLKDIHANQEVGRKNSECIDWLMTELNKYKTVIEEEKPVEPKWFETEEFQTLVAEKLKRIEQEIGGGDESSETGGKEQSRVDILEQQLAALQQAHADAIKQHQENLNTGMNNIHLKHEDDMKD